MSLKRFFLLIVTLSLVIHCSLLHGQSVSKEPRLNVPVAPVPVLSAGRNVLVYELYVLNTATQELKIKKVEARDENDRPLLTYSGDSIAKNWKLLGGRGEKPVKIASGVAAVMFMWIAIDPQQPLPKTLTHKVEYEVGGSGGTISGAETSVLPAASLVLPAPVGSGNWWIALGPSNTSEHRRAVIRVGDDDTPHLAQRFAIDWVKVDEKGTMPETKVKRMKTGMATGPRSPRLRMARSPIPRTVFPITFPAKIRAA